MAVNSFPCHRFFSTASRFRFRRQTAVPKLDVPIEIEIRDASNVTTRRLLVEVSARTASRIREDDVRLGLRAIFCPPPRQDRSTNMASLVYRARPIARFR